MGTEIPSIAGLPSRNRMKVTTPNLNRVEHPASPRVPQDAAYQNAESNALTTLPTNLLLVEGA
jgi:hypothetical protein